MALGEYGIIFHDLFLDKELFNSIFKEYYKEKQADIELTVQSLLDLLNNYNVKSVTKGMAAEFQRLWKQFQYQVLLNEKPLQLLTVYRDDRDLGTNSQFSTIIDQERVEKAVKTRRGWQYGINTGDEIIKDSFEVIKARQVENFLQNHAGQLLKQLYYEEIKRPVAEALHDYHSDLLNEIYTTSDRKKRQHITGLVWHKLIYGELHFMQWQGNAYEAYFNHMANHEPELFDYLSEHGKEMTANFNLKANKTVFEEEGGYTFNLGNFPKLMMGQVNDIPWFAGGDIVIINNKGEVIYNIQLKTTSAQTVFPEKVSALKTFLINFIDAETIEEKTELLFNEFKNTAANEIPEKLGEELRKTIENLLKDLKNSLQP